MKASTHGIVRAVDTHFEYEDGTIYYPFGTTVYALLYQEMGVYEQTMNTLQNAPFNKIRFCIFPKHYEWNYNEPSFFPFERDGRRWDTKHPCEAYWKFLEETIVRLDDMGIQADLILFHPYDRWGFSKLTKEEAINYLDYAVRRLSKYQNIWWSLANEYDLLEYEKKDWECFAAFIRKNDIYKHLLSNHNAVHFWDFSNPDTTHVCLQTENVRRVAEYLEIYHKPVIVDECGYEGNLENNWGNLSGFEMTDRFWTVVAGGGYCTHGETFLNPEGILWWSKGGTLKGESVERIRFLRNIIESLNGPLTIQEGGYAQYSVEEVRKIAAMEPEKRPMDFRPGEYTYGMLWATDQEICTIRQQTKRSMIHNEEDVYLYYLGTRCPAWTTIQLPAKNRYQFEVIDVWEMTREPAKTELIEKENEGEKQEVGECTYRVVLPGKPGIAVLASKVS